MPAPRVGHLRQRVVCHLVERLDYGGAETLVHRLSTGMRGNGYVPIVCCLQQGPLLRHFEQDGIHVECLNIQRRSILEGPAFVAFVYRVLRALTQTVRRHHVDLIHAHLPDCIIWAAFAGAISRTPVVGTYHGLGILPSGRRVWDPRNRVRRVLYRLTERLSDRTIAVSIPIKELLCRDLGFDERRTIVLLNGVNTAAFAREGHEGPTRVELGLDNRRVITCVGRLVANKGQRFLIEAMAVVVRQYPDVALLLVGDGPEMTRLQDRARELQIVDHVRIAMHRSDVPTILAMTEVFVLPSLAEGIPLALVEGMAAGKPVVATAVPGNLDVIMDDRYGILVPPRDATALAGALCALLGDPVRARTMAARGQARAREHFDISRAVAATTALYDDVLAERSRTGRKGAHPITPA